MGPLRIVFCFMFACFGARASDARRGVLDRCGEGDVECVPGEIRGLAHARVLSHVYRPVHRDGRIGHGGQARRVDDDARESVESEALDVSLRLEASRDGAELGLVAPDELSQRGDVHLLAALHAPVEVREDLEGHNLEII